MFQLNLKNHLNLMFLMFPKFGTLLMFQQHLTLPMYH
jgi:hypothetical protein